MTGFVFLRVRAHRLLLTAALLTVVLTTSVLATFTAFAGAIGDAALRRTLQHQDADRATVEVHTDLDGAPPGPVDAAVRKILAGSFAGLPAHVAASTQSGPYGLPTSLRPPNTPRSDDPDLTLLATFDRARLVLTAGAWPAPAAKGAPEVQIAVPQAAAQALRIAPGRTLTLTDRFGGPPLTIRVTGVYRPADGTAPYWRLDPLAGRGVHTVAFTTYGPMLADPGTFASGRIAPKVMAWQAAGDFRQATAAQIDPLERSVRATLQYLHDDATTSGTQADSSMTDLLDGLRRSMLVTRSTLLIGALQLIILAGFALLLVAQLLAEERAGESALLRARGGSRARLARLTAAESLLLALPAAIAAPLLAGPVTRLLAETGAMTRTGVHLGDGSAGLAWLVAACTALACALAVIVPALRTGGSFAQRAARRRRGGVQAGADLALLIVAGVAYWQLQRRASGSGALSAGAGGGLGIDPVLVAAPALCLLAGTVLVLRLLPLAARLGERRAARGRGLALALAGWQLARRPRRGASAALLLVLAVAMGMFAIGQGASWERSQHDQADYTVGADLRVTGMTTPPFGQHGIYASVPGITAAAAATRQEMLLTQQRHATLLMMDTERAAKAMRFRPDLTGGRPAADVLRLLRPAGGAAAAHGIEVPGTARTVTFDGVLALTDEDGNRLVDPLGDHLTATVVDSRGIGYEFALGDVPGDGLPHPLTLDLGSQTGTAGGAPAGPLRIVRIDVSYAPSGVHEQAVLTLTGGQVRNADGSAGQVERHSADAWTSTTTFDFPTIAALPKAAQPSSRPPQTRGAALMSVAYSTGLVPSEYLQPGAGGVTLRIGVTAPAPPPLVGVATDSYLKAVGAKVGDSVRVQISGIDAKVRIAGVVHGMPGTGDDPAFGDRGTGTAPDADRRARDVGALLVDLGSVDRMLIAQYANSQEPTEWWLAAAPGHTARVAAALRSRTDVDTVMVRDEVVRQLRADPLGAGPQAALPAAVVAAAVLAALGFAVSSAGAIRERSAEFAVLRALGAPRRKLARMIAAEQGLLVLVSLAVGVVLGALLTRLVTPLIVLTAQAAPPVPELTVVLPIGRLAELVAAVLVVPLLVVLVTALRRGDPASALRRQGEE